MKHDMSRELFEYWTKLRGSRKAPMRLELDPSAIASLLSNTFVLERLDPVTYNYRLAGTRICSYHTKELRSTSFIDQWGGKDKETLESLLYTITEDAAGAVIGYVAYARDDVKVPFEALLLPLARGNGSFDRVIGITAPMADEYWVGVLPIQSAKIKSVRLLWPVGLPKYNKETSNTQFPAKFGESQLDAATEARPNFKVIKGGLS